VRTVLEETRGPFGLPSTGGGGPLGGSGSRFALAIGAMIGAVVIAAAVRHAVRNRDGG